MPGTVPQVHFEVGGEGVAMARYVGQIVSGNEFFEDSVSVQEGGEKIQVDMFENI